MKIEGAWGSQDGGEGKKKDRDDYEVIGSVKTERRESGWGALGEKKGEAGSYSLSGSATVRQHRAMN